MIHPDYPVFANVTDQLFSLRESGKAILLRKALGIALDRRFANFQKGVVQEKKSQFINLAKEVSGAAWSAREPHKIITTLKNTGDGDEEMTRALYFLCCITDEFDELRDTLFQVIGNDVVVDAPATWPPRLAFRFRDLIAANPKEIRHQVKARIVTLAEQRTAMQRADQLNKELKSEFGSILDDRPVQEANADDATLSSSPIDPSEDKIIGRSFVENHAAKFVEAHSSPPCGTLSIIDIDDLTKINKVYTRTVGDQVIQIVGMLTEDAVKDCRQNTGRCGDDTFFVALANEDEDSTIKFMERLLKSVQDFGWKQIAADLRVTVSIGIAGFKPKEPSLDMAVRAGRGMRDAKAMGGNSTSIGPRYLPHSDTLSPVSTLRVWS